MKKIYFAGSISSGREFAPIYRELIKTLKNYGNVLTEHIGEETLTSAGENLSDNTIHDRDVGWISLADVIIAEVSVSSLGVGYELGRAVEQNKNILCLYQPLDGRRLTGMISGCDGIVCKKYKDILQANKIIKNYFETII